MLSFFIIVLIFLENSLVTTLPYNFVAIPFLTYLAYKKRKTGLFIGIIILVIISKNSNIFIELGVIFSLIFIISYVFTKILGYKNINLIYYSLVQFIVYGGYLYLKVSHFNIIQGIVMLFGYILVNYIFIKISREKKWNQKENHKQLK